MGSEVSQYLYSYAIQPSRDWRYDYALDIPLLIAPRNNTNMCVENIDWLLDGTPFEEGGNSGIDLVWTSVTGAEYYILQWCNNSSFRGPTLRALQVADSGNLYTTYTLKYITDVWYGETIYWRVIAYNTHGGVGAKSDTWQATYDCPGGNKSKQPQKPSNNDSQICDKFGVRITLDGPEHMMCCDKQMYTLNAQYSCTADDGAPITIYAVNYAIAQGSVGGVSIIQQNDKLVVVEIAATATNSFTLTASITFQVTTDEGTKFFTCTGHKKIYTDCLTGKASEKPWLKLAYYPLPGVVFYTDPFYSGDMVGTDDTMDPGLAVPGILGQAPYCVSNIHDGLLASLGQNGAYSVDLIAVGPVIEINRTYNYFYYDNGGCSSGIPIGELTYQINEARVHIPVGCGLWYDAEYGLRADKRMAGRGLGWGSDAWGASTDHRRDCQLGIHTCGGFFGFNTYLGGPDGACDGCPPGTSPQDFGIGEALFPIASELIDNVFLGNTPALPNTDPVSASGGPIVMGWTAASMGSLDSTWCGSGYVLALNYDCSLKVTAGAGWANQTALGVDTDHLAGRGLLTQIDELCDKLQVDLGCGLALDGNQIVINGSDLGGAGIAAGSGCSLSVITGCGTYIDPDTHAVTFNGSDVAGNGLVVGGTGCSLDVNPGCGIYISADQVTVKRDDLIGNGLKAGYGTCSIDINYGCGLTLSYGALIVNKSTLAGKGLQAAGLSSSCALDVFVGCHLTIETDNSIGVSTDDGLCGDGLTNGTSGSCENININPGCGLKISGGTGTGGAVMVDNSALAGAHLVTSGTCALAVNVTSQTVVTGVTCNGDGTITVTTATVNVVV
jgi:hypothetical protein